MKRTMYYCTQCEIYKDKTTEFAKDNEHRKDTEKVCLSCAAANKLKHCTRSTAEYQCAGCKVFFTESKHLTPKQMKHHSQSKKPVLCLQCKDAWCTPKHPAKERCYKCEGMKGIEQFSDLTHFARNKKANKLVCLICKGCK